MSNHFIKNKDCTDIRENLAILVEQNGRKYVGLNNRNKPFAVTEVDDCFVKSEQEKKCDFLIINLEEKIAYFIELKGKDLLMAIKQIDNSISKFQVHLKKHVINARIVLTKVNAPDYRDTRYIRFEKRIKSLNGNIIKKSRVLKENI